MALLLIITTLPSCLKNDEEQTSSTCAIVSFSVGNITSYVTEKKYDTNGNARDTLVKRIVSGSSIYFNIDQVNNLIHVVDSLPHWINLTRVVPSYSSYGQVLLKASGGEDLYSSLRSGTDSIDFSDKVELLCVSTDGTAKRTYTVDIYKHKVATDTLKWRTSASNLNITEPTKAFYVDGSVYLFAKNSGSESIVTYADENDPTVWSAPVTIPVDHASINLFGNNFYGLGDDEYIYRAAPEQVDGTWEKAADRTVKRLLAADKYRLYAYDGSAIVGTSDFTQWEEQGMDDLDMLPETAINSSSYASSTNDQLQIAVMSGLSSNNSENGVTWFKISSTDATTDQPWSYIQVTPDNAYGMPILNHLSVTCYNRSLYAIGMEEGEYRYLYRSDDNGITWHPQTRKATVPTDLDATNGTACIVTVDKNLWIIQENGNVWHGSMQ